MKKSLLAIAVAGAFAGAAQAAEQDQGVTLYGIIDGALRYTTNSFYNAATNTGTPYTGFSQGLFNGSRFGIKGTEDLGGGKKAIYVLEGGVVLGTGVSDQNGQIFGRQAYVGLADEKLGTVTAGRQYGNLSDALGTGDVFGEKHGNEVYASGVNQGDVVAENTFFYQEMGYRWDNSIQYANKFGAVKLSLMHSFQGTTNTQTGTKQAMNSVAVGYASEKFSISGGYQTESDVFGRKHNDFGVGANFMYGEKNGIYAFYLNSKYDLGFTRLGQGTNSGLAGTQPAARQDSIMSVSANYYATSNLNLIGAFYHDSASNIAVAGDTGTRNGFLVTADYYLSKNTDTYVALAHTAFSGSLVGNANGGQAAPGGVVGVGPSSANTAMLGLRHRF